MHRTNRRAHAIGEKWQSKQTQRTHSTPCTNSAKLTGLPSPAGVASDEMRAGSEPQCHRSRVGKGVACAPFHTFSTPAPKNQSPISKNSDPRNSTFNHHRLSRQQHILGDTTRPTRWLPNLPCRASALSRSSLIVSFYLPQVLPIFFDNDKRHSSGPETRDAISRT